MKLKHFKSVVVIPLYVSLVFGCSTTGKLNDLSPGMATSEVISIIGEPEIARETISNQYGQVIELWHYELYNNHVDAHEAYYFYFYNGKLVRWGKAVDLPRKEVCKMKFK